MKFARRRGYLAAFAVTLFVLVVGGVAFAEIPDSGGVIHACYSSTGADATNGTQLNVINSAKASCNGKGQKELTWGQQGPQGLKGDKGDKGDTGASGTSQAYFAQNTHVVESADTPQEIVGLADLPAGKYIFTTEVFNSAYATQNSYNFQALECDIRLNGQAVDLPSAGGFSGFVVGDQLENVDQRYFTDTVALTVPAGSAIRLACKLFSDGDGASLGVGRITALKVTAIN